MYISMSISIAINQAMIISSRRNMSMHTSIGQTINVNISISIIPVLLNTNFSSIVLLL